MMKKLIIEKVVVNNNTKDDNENNDDNTNSDNSNENDNNNDSNGDNESDDDIPPTDLKYCLKQIKIYLPKCQLVKHFQNHLSSTCQFFHWSKLHEYCICV